MTVIQRMHFWLMVRYLHTRDIPKFRVCDLLSLFLFFFFPTDHRIILKHINHSECFLRDNQTCHIQFIFECLFSSSTDMHDDFEVIAA